MTIPSGAPIDELGRAFLRLALAIDRHVEGYVDAYYGPPELRAEAAKGPPRPIDELRDAVATLRDVTTAVDDPARRNYFDTMLGSMDTTLRLAAGETFDYADEVEMVYGVQPALCPEDVFEEAHHELDSLLPPRDRLADRLIAWRGQYRVPPRKLSELLEMTHEVTRRLTHQRFDLPADESVAIELVEGQPWDAYNWYLGGGHSRIEINTDQPLNALNLVDLLAHEAYPGHHTEMLLKEQHLVREKGYTEMSVAILTSPAAVISEGIATTAREIIFPERGAQDWSVDALLPTARLPPEIPGDIARVDEATDMIGRQVVCNAALLFHTGQIDQRGVLDYLKKYGLMSEDRALQKLRLLTTPLYRGYVFTYTAGRALIEQAAPGKEKPALFARLLTEPLLPADLMAIAEAREEADNDARPRRRWIIGSI